MNTTKKWYQSATIGGIIIAAVGALLVYLNIDPGTTLPVNPDVAQVTEYVNQVKAAHGNISTLIGIGMNAIGYIVALVGRIKAKSVIATPATSK